MTAHRYDYDPDAPGIAPPELGPLRPTLRKGDKGETVAELPLYQRWARFTIARDLPRGDPSAKIARNRANVG